MTITSFDNDIPLSFVKEKTLEGRLMLFINHTVSRVLKRDLIKKDRDKISFIVVDKEYIELKYDDNFLGHVKLITMTKDFIFKQ
jgi:hypothetical protein